jgi:hypothetical protein
MKKRHKQEKHVVGKCISVRIQVLKINIENPKNSTKNTISSEPLANPKISDPDPPDPATP